MRPLRRRCGPRKRARRRECAAAQPHALSRGPRSSDSHDRSTADAIWARRTRTSWPRDEGLVTMGPCRLHRCHRTCRVRRAHCKSSASRSQIFRSSASASRSRSCPTAAMATDQVGQAVGPSPSTTPAVGTGCRVSEDADRRPHDSSSFAYCPLPVRGERAGRASRAHEPQLPSPPPAGRGIPLCGPTASVA